MLIQRLALAAFFMLVTTSLAADTSEIRTDQSAAKVNEGFGIVVVPTAITIPAIQGDGPISPVQGVLVETTGVVVGDFQAGTQLDGFFLQDPVGDSIPATSDGIFVYDPDGANVAVGDNVTVTAVVGSFNDNTQLTSVSNIDINSSGNSLPPTIVSLPESVDGELERYEGMLIEIGQTMTITNAFSLGRYGQLSLSSPNDNGKPGQLFTPTNQFPANSVEAIALAEENARRVLILDDGMDVNSFGDNPDPVPYLGGPPANTLRVGDTTTKIVGVLEQNQSDYRIHPTVAPVFTATNPRKPSPSKAQSGLSIAGFNVLNYFNTIDTGNLICGPFTNRGCRGADSAAEFTRQRDKIFSAMQAMDADIIGLVEIENNGLGPGSAIEDLVTGLNTKIGSLTYQVLAVDQGATQGIGDDVISVGIIYKPASVTPIGTPAVLDTGAFSSAIPEGGLNRQPIAASFLSKRSGEKLTIALNHFKSKGGAPFPALGNANDDQGDGQGPWNLRRTNAAKELADWLATFPTGVDDDDILVLGDLNAYAKEDPLLAFEDKGYSNLVRQFEGESSYSFNFRDQAGALDHMLSTASLASKVAAVETWHINADEPSILDYNTEFKANIAPAPSGYYVDDPFRASDHDPVIITLKRDQEKSDQGLCWATKASNDKVMLLCL